MVAELRGLWAKQKMQSRQMKMHVTVKHKTLKSVQPDTSSSMTQDKFAARDVWLNNTEDARCADATKTNSHKRRAVHELFDGVLVQNVHHVDVSEKRRALPTQSRSA